MSKYVQAKNTRNTSSNYPSFKQKKFRAVNRRTLEIFEFSGRISWFLENLLHIAHRLDFEEPKWRVTAPLREQYNKTKQHIQEELLKHFHVKVDQPRAGGAGTRKRSFVAACFLIRKN
jgi:hypothetical protein